MKHRAFTLIELLVVVAIIVALLGILLPSMGRAIEATHRAVCASQLKQMALGTLAYAADNFAKMPGMVHQWNGAAYPDYMRVKNTGSGEWCIESMNPYIQAFEVDAASGIEGAVGGVAMCPSVDRELLMRYLRERFLHGSGYAVTLNFVEYQYLYWGRVDRVVDQTPWQLRGQAARELVESRPDGSRVLLSDVINFDWSDQAWRYNHGTRGWAFNEAPYMPWDRDSVPNLTGINRAFGDGSVRWRSRGEFPYLKQMNAPAGYLGGGIVSSNGNGDAFYY